MPKTTKAKRGKRKRLATGIYQDKYGIAIPVDGVEHRYPLGTPLETLRKYKAEFMRARPSRRVRTNTLDYHFEEYLKTLPDPDRHYPDGTVREGRRRRDERALWRHWQDAGFGARAPMSVTDTEIHQQLAAWETTKAGVKGQPFAAATRKHLRRLLGVVYRTAHGRAGANPVRDVRAITVRYEEPRAISFEIIARIFDQMSDVGPPPTGSSKDDGAIRPPSATKLWLRVMAFTGLPPAQLRRIDTARDLDLRHKELHGRPRRKGAGTSAKRLALNDLAVAAFRDVAAAGFPAVPGSRVMARAWRRAVERAREAWETEMRRPWPLPRDVRAYDLRHSYGTAMMLATRNLKSVSDSLMHATLTTTQRYTLAAVAPHLRDAARAMSEHLRGTHRGTRRKAKKTGRKYTGPS